MRYLILSDIHSNLSALEAVLAAVEGKFEKALCLGDLIGYGPDPEEVVSRVRALNPVVLRGNHDRAGSGLTDAEDFNPSARRAALWTRDRLSTDNLNYVRALPVGPLAVEDFLLVHGSTFDEDEYVFEAYQALETLRQTSHRLIFFGHTHLQGGFVLHDKKLEVLRIHLKEKSEAAELRLDPDARYLLNPGSVGQPRDGDNRAACAIYDAAEAMVEFWRVPYDIELTQRRMSEAGLPEALIQRLSFGR
ncbi:MAG TPA: metallophosphoesterase family protein [Candidatus Acidoferrales bacterium]